MATQQNNPKSTDSKRRRYTRRQFFKQAATFAALAPVAGSISTIVEKPAPEVKAPTSQPSKLFNVQTDARIPNRARIVDPATLADYCARMEAHLSEQAEWVREWATGSDNPPMREMLENELYALVDTLAGFLAVTYEAGLSDMVVEILTVDDAVNYVQCIQSPANQPEDRQMMIDDHLWGQGPVASETFCKFSILKTVIGEAIERQWVEAA